MAKKLYTAFISSPGSMKEERKNILNILLTFDIFPVCMEHFVVSSYDGFHDIEELIDDSNFFILLLGKRYGSRETLPTGAKGLSWTEKEYRYAVERAKTNSTNLIAFQFNNLTEIIHKYHDDISDKELEDLVPGEEANDIRSQIAFSALVQKDGMVMEVADIFAAREALATYINNAKANQSAPGWIKAMSSSGVNKLKFDKIYYQVHLSTHDENYIRIGTAKLTAVEDTYSCQIHIEGTNYKPTSYNPARHELIYATRSKTEWEGDYHYNDGKLWGVYTARKRVKEQFGDKVLDAAARNGIHKLSISEDRSPYVMDGTFQDAIGYDNIDLVGKSGEIYFFETDKDRFRFIENECSDILEHLQEEV